MRRLPAFDLLPWLLVYLAVILPLIIDVFSVVRSDPFAWRMIIPGGRSLVLLLRSFLLAGETAILAGSLGWLVALYLWGRSSAGRFWVLVALALVSLPPYVHTLSWVRLETFFLDLSRMFGWSGSVLYGWFGVLWVQVALSLPLALVFSWLGLSQISPELVEASRLAGPDGRMAFRILLPLSAPVALTGSGLIFLLTSLEYAVPSLLGLPTYPMEIFSEFSLSASPGRAFLVSIPLLLLSFVVLLPLLGPLRRLAFVARFQSTNWIPLMRWPRGLRWLFVFIMPLAGSLVLLPFVGLVWQVGDLGVFLQASWAARKDALFSFQVSFFSIFLMLPLAWIAAKRLLNSTSSAWLTWLLVLSPAALPASLVGVGLASFPGLFPGLLFLRNGPFLSGLGITARYLPLVTLGLLAAWRTVDPALFEAGLLFQPAGWRRLVQVELPLLSPGLLIGSGLIFAWGLAEFGASLLTTPPGQAALSLRIYNYLHYGASQEVAGLSLLLVGTMLFVSGILVFTALKIWGMLNPSRGNSDPV